MSAPTVPDQAFAAYPADALSFDRPVARASVHKTGPGEAFITDFAQVGDDRFLVAAELPRSHAFYGDTSTVTPAIDPMTLLEIGRQSGYIVLHGHHGIPLENTFVMRSMGSSLVPGADALRIEGPARVVMHLWLQKPFYRDGQLVGFLGGGPVQTVDGTAIGEVHASFSWITHDLFKAFRAGTRQQLGLPATPPPAAWLGQPRATEAYGRRSAQNALLAEPAHDGDVTTAYLRPDLDYVGLFDHAYDHVPGMVQTEGSKQLAVLGAAHRLGLRPDQVVASSLEATFHSINEVDFETVCTGTFSPDPATGGIRAHVSAVQDDRSLGDVDVLVTPRGLLLD